VISSCICDGREPLEVEQLGGWSAAGPAFMVCAASRTGGGIA
jgi:hypothetical protein